MATPAVTREQAYEAQVALAQHGTKMAAASALGISRGAFENRHRRGLELYGDLASPDPPPAAVREPLTSFEEAWRQWQRCIGMAQDRYSPPSLMTKDSTKILVIPDLHVPFHEADMLATCLARESDADHVVCIGDMADGYAMSRFVKYERLSFADEWAQVTLVMQEIASRFPKVSVIVGNHEARLERQLRLRLTEDMVDAVQYMTGGLLCPLTALARRYPNVEIARHETPSGHTLDWCLSVGDAWFGHPEKFSSVPGSAIRKVEEWLADNERALGFDRYRLIAMGHTHAWSQFPWHAGQLLVEVGCLCQQQGYMTQPRIGGRPQRRGYLTLVQHGGVTDLNSVRFHWLDAEAA